MFLILSILILLCSATIATGQNDSTKLDYGTLDGSVYTNRYFGLQLTIPARWQVPDDQAKARINQAGRDLLKSENQKVQENIDASVQNTVQLLTLYKYPPETQAAEANAGFICGAEKITVSGVTSGRAYLEATKKALKLATVPTRVEKDIYSEHLNGVDFAVMDVIIDYPAGQVKERYHAYVKKGYALFFISVYTREEDLKTLNEVLKSVKLQ